MKDATATQTGRRIDMAGRFDFAGNIRDAIRDIVSLRERLGWPPGKLKKRVGIGRIQLKREIADEEEWLEWLRTNAPQAVTNLEGGE